MKKPEFYYAALEFKENFKVLSESEICNYNTDGAYEYFCRHGIFRGKYYQIMFSHHGELVTASFVYTNFKKSHCDFHITYYFTINEVLKDFVDFRDFCFTMGTMMNLFFYKKGFVVDKKFIGG